MGCGPFGIGSDQKLKKKGGFNPAAGGIRTLNLHNDPKEPTSWAGTRIL
jgi:hypothetical protein